MDRAALSPANWCAYGQAGDGFDPGIASHARRPQVRTTSNDGAPFGGAEPHPPASASPDQVMPSAMQWWMRTIRARSSCNAHQVELPADALGPAVHGELGPAGLAAPPAQSPTGMRGTSVTTWRARSKSGHPSSWYRRRLPPRVGETRELSAQALFNTLAQRGAAQGAA